MTLPEKNPKAYLELSPAEGGALVEGQPQHIAELEALFRQRGIPCARAPGGVAGWEALRLAPDANLDQAAEVLEAYKTEKGS